MLWSYLSPGVVATVAAAPPANRTSSHVCCAGIKHHSSHMSFGWCCDGTIIVWDVDEGEAEPPPPPAAVYATAVVCCIVSVALVLLPAMPP
jgi:hypothetical protein